MGRDGILDDVLRILADPNHAGMILWGQRRIGKTSILQRLEALLSSRLGHRPVLFDLQDKAASPLGEVLVELANVVAAALELPEPVPDAQIEAWFRDRWLPSVLDALPAEVSLVLLLDEFDVLADPRVSGAALVFFPYLRQLLVQYAPRLRFVFVLGRSLDDLSNVAHALFKTLPCKPVSTLSREDAAALMRLGEQSGTLHWTREGIDAAWALTRGHPLLLQSLCWYVWRAAGEVTAADVEAAVPRVMDSNRAALEWMWAGLPPWGRVAAAALAKAGPKGVATDDQLQAILHAHGGQVVIRDLREAPRLLIEWDMIEAPEQGGYRFRVELWRRWIEQYKPLASVQKELDRAEVKAENLYQLALTYHGEGDLQQAMATVRDAVKIHPDHVGANELLAGLLISQEDWAGARDVLEPLYEKQPAVARSPLVRVLLAQAKTVASDDNRLVLYERVLSIDASNATAAAEKQRIWRERGDRARSLGNLREAVAAYQAAGLDGEARQVYAIETSYEEAVAAMRRRDLDRAIEMCRMVVAADPRHKKAVELLFNALSGVKVAALQEELESEKSAHADAEFRAKLGLYEVGGVILIFIGYGLVRTNWQMVSFAAGVGMGALTVGFAPRILRVAVKAFRWLWKAILDEVTD